MKTRAFFFSLSILTASSLAFAQQPPTRTENGGVIIEQVPTEPAPAPPAPEPPPPPPPKPEKKKSIPIGLRVDGGYGVRTLEKISVTGADFGLGIGAQPTKHIAIYGAARGFFGSTEFGLGVKALRIACDFDIVIDRFRIGFDPGIFVVGIDRATKDQTIVAWGPKLGAAARFDVVRADVFALFLRASADGGPTFSDGSLFGGVMVGAGIDFDIKPGDRESL
jgi:hypothetical protein